jgi:hypothetical protein
MPIKNSINNQSTGFTVGSTGDLTITSGNAYLPNTTSAPVGVVFQGGVRFIHTFGADGCTYIGKNAGSIAASNTSNNTTAVGRNCLTAITTGNGNTGVGDSVLGVCTTQGSNTGMGTRALQQSLGNNNTAIGFRASEGAVGSTAIRNTILGSTCGASISSGGENVYIGFFAALSASTSAQNTVIGSQAFLSATTAANNNVVIGYKAGTLSTGFSQNTIVGTVALDKATTGIYNLALGYGSGTNYTGAESHNILLHSDGVLGDNNTLRIGQSTGAGTRQLNKAFICGIDGVNVGSVAKVLTMASDQLGTATITAGAGISVTPAANTITIAASTNSTLPAFHAYVNATIANVTGNNTNYQIVFNTETFDQNSNYNNATGLFTAPVTGRYAFSYSIYVTGLVNHGQYFSQLVTTSLTYSLCDIQPNANILTSATNLQIATSTIFVAMTAGDTAFVRINVNGGTGTQVVDIFGAVNDPRTNFSGYLIC